MLSDIPLPLFAGTTIRGQGCGGQVFGEFKKPLEGRVSGFSLNRLRDFRHPQRLARRTAGPSEAAATPSPAQHEPFQAQ